MQSIASPLYEKQHSFVRIKLDKKIHPLQHYLKHICESPYIDIHLDVNVSKHGFFSRGFFSRRAWKTILHNCPQDKTIFLKTFDDKFHVHSIPEL